MPTFGEEMKALASELTEEFSAELGKSLFIKLLSDTYDPVTGDSVKNTSQESVYMVFEEIENNEEHDASYLRAHMQCTVAGQDISVVPARDDTVVTPEGTYHRVVNVKFDQYRAAYVMHIERHA